MILTLVRPWFMNFNVGPTLVHQFCYWPSRGSSILPLVHALKCQLTVHRRSTSSLGAWRVLHLRIQAISMRDLQLLDYNQRQPVDPHAERQAFEQRTRAQQFTEHGKSRS
jgi:hypothetical protein